MRLQPAALADYERAQTIQELTVINAPGPVNWIGDTRSFWYAKQVKGGTQYMLIDAENETRNPAFDHQRLAAAIIPGQNHGTGVLANQHYLQDYFVHHLLKVEPPDWNRTPWPTEPISGN